MSIHRLLISETLMAFLTGSLPLFMVVYSKPDSKVVENLSLLNPGDPVIIYFFYLFLLHICIWAISKFFLKPSEAISSFFGSAHKFSHQIGFTIHNIYRAIAGAISAAIGLLVYKHSFDGEVFLVSIASSFLVFGALFMCCLLTWLSERTAPKQKWF